MWGLAIKEAKISGHPIIDTIKRIHPNIYSIIVLCRPHGTFCECLRLPEKLLLARFVPLCRDISELITGQAAIAWEASGKLSVEDVEVAPPKAHEVRVHILWTGVSPNCQS